MKKEIFEKVIISTVTSMLLIALIVAVFFYAIKNMSLDCVTNPFTYGAKLIDYSCDCVCFKGNQTNRLFFNQTNFIDIKDYRLFNP